MGDLYDPSNDMHPYHKKKNEVIRLCCSFSLSINGCILTPIFALVMVCDNNLD
jgi:hypothetical protein